MQKSGNGNGNGSGSGSENRNRNRNVREEAKMDSKIEIKIKDKEKSKKNFNSNLNLKIFSFIAALGIILLLVFSAPAEAYVLSLTIYNNEVNLGGKVNFAASLNINSNEFLDIDYLILNLINTNYPVNITCKFNVNGSPISGCQGITITLLSSSANYSYGYGYGYGYGYNNGILKYNITLDTSGKIPGNYSSSIAFVIDNNIMKQDGGYVNIKSIGGGGKLINNKCYLKEGDSIYNKNIRGSNGNLVINGISYLTSKNKLMLSVPSIKAKSGSGSITSQLGRDRFSYSFKIKGIQDSDETAQITVSGYYTLGKAKKQLLNTVITIDKVNGKASLSASNIGLSGMDLIYNGNGC